MREHALFIIGTHDEQTDGSWVVVLFLVFSHIHKLKRVGKEVCIV